MRGRFVSTNLILVSKVFTVYLSPFLEKKVGTLRHEQRETFPTDEKNLIVEKINIRLKSL